jgi:small subunit ribosomal protein S6
VKNIRDYEVTYIVNRSWEEVKVKEVVEKFKQFILERNGEIKGVENFGKKKFAYKIGGKKDGVYVSMKFKGNNELIKDLERNLKLAEEVLRHILVRL